MVEILGLNRRQILVGSTAMLLLRPFVTAINAFAEGPVAGGVFLTLYKSQGLYPGNNPANWIPKVQNNSLILPTALKGYEPVKDLMTFVKGLDNDACYDCKFPNGQAQPWHSGLKSVFTGQGFPYAATNEPDLAPFGESIDHYIARRMGTESFLMNPYWFNTGGKNENYNSWRKEPNGLIARIAPHGHPRDAFHAAFDRFMPPVMSTNDGKSKEERALRAKKSILDFAGKDLARVREQLSAEHRPQMDQHLDALRSLEKSLMGANGNASSATVSEQCTLPSEPSSSDAGWAGANQAVFLRRVAAMREVALAIMRCGLRPVMGFHIGDENGGEMLPGYWKDDCVHPDGNKGRNYHNEIWHAAGDGGGTFHVNIEREISNMFAELLIGMKNIRVGADSNLLEKSLAVYGTSMSFDHSNFGQSFYVAGTAGGRVKGGRLLSYGEVVNGGMRSGRAHNDLLVSMCQAWGYTDVKTFGDPKYCKGGLEGFLST